MHVGNSDNTAVHELTPWRYPLSGENLKIGTHPYRWSYPG